MGSDVEWLLPDRTGPDRTGLDGKTEWTRRRPRKNLNCESNSPPGCRKSGKREGRSFVIQDCGICYFDVPFLKPFNLYNFPPGKEDDDDDDDDDLLKSAIARRDAPCSPCMVSAVSMTVAFALGYAALAMRNATPRVAGYATASLRASPPPSCALSSELGETVHCNSFMFSPSANSKGVKRVASQLSEERKASSEAPAVALIVLNASSTSSDGMGLRPLLQHMWSLAKPGMRLCADGGANRLFDSMPSDMRSRCAFPFLPPFLRAAPDFAIF
jgi:hypothetical protein